MASDLCVVLERYFQTSDGPDHENSSCYHYLNEDFEPNVTLDVERPPE